MHQEVLPSLQGDMGSVGGGRSAGAGSSGGGSSGGRSAGGGGNDMQVSGAEAAYARETGISSCSRYKNFKYFC
jgi:hypothetical protein